jgi:hypothetical protein
MGDHEHLERRRLAQRRHDRDPTRRTARPVAGALLVAASFSVSLALLPAAHANQHGTPPSGAAAVQAGQRSVPGSAISAFCDHFPVKTVSSVVGANEHLLEAVIENSSYDPLRHDRGRVGVIVSMRPGPPAGEIATLRAAEARVAAESAKGAGVVFTALASIGRTAIRRTYVHSLNGGQLVGVAGNTPTTAYGVALGRPAATFGHAAAQVPVLERLLSLDMAA